MSLILAASAAYGEEPAKDDLFDSATEGAFRGWKIEGKGIGAFDQSYALFQLNGVYLIASTIPEKREAKGGFLIERIRQTLKVKPLVGEVMISGFDCSFLGLIPALALFNERTKTVTGYFVTGDSIERRRWLVDEPELCAYGGD